MGIEIMAKTAETKRNGYFFIFGGGGGVNRLAQG
jgi:hypothetical protein